MSHGLNLRYFCLLLHWNALSFVGYSVYAHAVFVFKNQTDTLWEVGEGLQTEVDCRLSS